VSVARLAVADNSRECAGLVVRAAYAAPNEVQIEGELDLATIDLLRVGVGAVGRCDLRIDASGISFVDCAGLASLVELARSTRASGAQFEMATMSPPLTRLVALTGADQEL
jgi:anti-anti-sigma factor